MEGNPGKKLWKILRTSKRHLPQANPGARTVNCTLTVAQNCLASRGVGTVGGPPPSSAPSAKRQCGVRQTAGGQDGCAFWASSWLFGSCLIPWIILFTSRWRSGRLWPMPRRVCSVTLFIVISGNKKSTRKNLRLGPSAGNPSTIRSHSPRPDPRGCRAGLSSGKSYRPATLRRM